MTTGDEDVEAFAVLSLSRYNTVPNNKIKIMGNAKISLFFHLNMFFISVFMIYPILICTVIINVPFFNLRAVRVVPRP